jgi:preprotein translocase subunit SecE
MIDVSLRVIGWIVLVIILLGIARFTSQGLRAWNFTKESRGELRKVVWPSRQETMQTTMLVLALVIALALIIWGLDSILLWLIGLLTGQRG